MHHHILYLFTLAKLTQKIAKTYTLVQTDSGRLAFCFCGSWGRHPERLPMPIDCTKNVDKNWNINIHANLDHAWAERYLITINTSRAYAQQGIGLSVYPSVCLSSAQKLPDLEI
jgi:hypothetical protein